MQAVIFDVDGILIDSEPFWRQAEIECFAEVDVHLTEADCKETTGIRIDEIVRMRHRQKPWSEKSIESVTQAIIDRTIDLVKSSGKPLAGVNHAIEFFRSQNVRLALASSSPPKLIQAILDRLDLNDAFEFFCSAESEPLGKPHPGVYLSALSRLNLPCESCVAIEDSLNGLIAAKAAKLKVIVVPEPDQREHPGFGIADLKLKSLEQISGPVWKQF